MDLDSAVLHIGEMPMFSDWVVDDDVIAITRVNDIYIKDPGFTSDSPKNLAMLAHELVHVGQFRNGMTWLSYLWDARDGYESSQYEQQAMKVEAQVRSAFEQAQRAPPAIPDWTPAPSSTPVQVTESATGFTTWWLVGMFVCGAAVWVLIPGKT